MEPALKRHIKTPEHENFRTDTSNSFIQPGVSVA